MVIVIRHRLVLYSSMLMLAGCSKPQPAPVSSMPPITPAAAHASSPAAAPAGQSVSGPVLETMDAASYTYVRVRGESGEVWAAAPQFTVKVGDRVRVPLEMPMSNFHSQSLNRDFPLIYFVSAISPEGGAAPAAAGAGAARPPIDVHGTPQAAPAAVTPPMPPPPGGMTIAGVWADRKSLAGKPVTVHGVVVKYNPGILGRNWIHLQDGTGRAADGSDDITITTAEDVTVAVGDVVTVTGTAVLDKNLGQGYAYPIVIENARVSAAKRTN
jgi:hypothetical protein